MTEITGVLLGALLVVLAVLAWTLFGTRRELAEMRSQPPSSDPAVGLLKQELESVRREGREDQERLRREVGTLTGEVADEVLRDRRHLSEDGLVVPVVAINKQTGALEGVPDIITRGFVMEDSQALLADAARMLVEVMEQTSVEERTDQGLIKEKLRVELRRFLRKRSGRRPFVLPVIMEI